MRAAFFDARVPEDVVSGRHFDRWWKQARQTQPTLLDYPMDMLIEGDVQPNDRDRPARWIQPDPPLELALSYRFDPGSAADGVTVHVPLASLGAVRETNFEWLVPAFRTELVVALLRTLPKRLRTPLVPIPDTATALLADVKPRSGPLLEVLAEAIERLRGVRIGAADWSLDDLPAHLRMTFSVEDEDGTVLASGRSLDALRDELRPALTARLETRGAGPRAPWNARLRHRFAAAHGRPGGRDWSARLPGARRRGRISRNPDLRKPRANRR